MRVLVQNLQKIHRLATELLEEHNPDVMILQEINLPSENHTFPASNVSRMGYGTAIGSRYDINNIKLIQSPYAEFGGLIHKKTTLATVESIQFVSFHGYNGQPFKSKKKLASHVHDVLAQIQPGPAVFCGDFNTWSQSHLDAVTTEMDGKGFYLAYSWPYPCRDFPLDHVFLRGVSIMNSVNYSCVSDHRGAILELAVKN